MTPEEKQQRLLEAQRNTSFIIQESSRLEKEISVNTTKNVIAKFQQIELKERCLRVKFLDWLSDKLSIWSEKVHQMSVKIDSPCVIKLPEKKEKSVFYNGNVKVSK